LKTLEKEQEPVIAAGTAARKASKEAYTADFKAWKARMDGERAHWEKTRCSKEKCYDNNDGLNRSSNRR
jgi:hypothetical protein